MTDQPYPKTSHIMLWVVQVLLALGLVYGGAMKLFLPIEDLSAMWPWTGEVSSAFVKLTGVLDIVGAIGLILPALLRIKPMLTPIAALCVLVLMIAAGIFHMKRGEGPQTGFTVIFGILAAMIAWGRFKKAPIAPQ